MPIFFILLEPIRPWDAIEPKFALNYTVYLYRLRSLIHELNTNAFSLVQYLKPGTIINSIHSIFGTREKLRDFDWIYYADDEIAMDIMYIGRVTWRTKVKKYAILVMELVIILFGLSVLFSFIGLGAAAIIFKVSQVSFIAIKSPLDWEFNESITMLGFINNIANLTNHQLSTYNFFISSLTNYYSSNEQDFYDSYETKQNIIIFIYQKIRQQLNFYCSFLFIVALDANDLLLFLKRKKPYFSDYATDLIGLFDREVRDELELNKLEVTIAPFNTKLLKSQTHSMEKYIYPAETPSFVAKLFRKKSDQTQSKEIPASTEIKNGTELNILNNSDEQKQSLLIDETAINSTADVNNYELDCPIWLIEKIFLGYQEFGYHEENRIPIPSNYCIQIKNPLNGKYVYRMISRFVHQFNVKDCYDYPDINDYNYFQLPENIEKELAFKQNDQFVIINVIPLAKQVILKPINATIDIINKDRETAVIASYSSAFKKHYLSQKEITLETGKQIEIIKEDEKDSKKAPVNMEFEVLSVLFPSVIEQYYKQKQISENEIPLTVKIQIPPQNK